MNTKEKIKLLKWATDYLWENDPEYVEGGCGDVSQLLEALAQKLDITGVRVVTGSVDTPSSGRIYHAWLRVDGFRLDPVAHARGVVKTYSNYREDPSLRDSLLLDASEFEEFADWRLPDLMETVSEFMKGPLHQEKVP